MSNQSIFDPAALNDKIDFLTKNAKCGPANNFSLQTLYIGQYLLMHSINKAHLHKYILKYCIDFSLKLLGSMFTPVYFYGHFANFCTTFGHTFAKHCQRPFQIAFGKKSFS